MKPYAFIVFLVFLFRLAYAQDIRLQIILDTESRSVIEKAKKYINLEPITVTSTVCERSAGGIHDFYSEGDYWWPNPENPNGLYIRRDGQTNPDIFSNHRSAMTRLNQITGILASAYMMTGDTAHVAQLRPHLKAWFVDKKTLMNPDLMYAQAIKGKVNGRGIGIIDSIHLLEVAKAVAAVEDSGAIPLSELQIIKKWFASYLIRLTEHQYGINERDHGNNHSIWWALQVAVFAELVGNTEQIEYVANMYKNRLLPDQMAADGSFPFELVRTKPYSYSLFSLNAMVAICQVLSKPENNLFAFTAHDGKNIDKALSFYYPYINDKSTWPFIKDVQHWEEWPVRVPFLLFGGLHLKNDDYISLWKSLATNFDIPEVIRAMPIRNPWLWIDS